jgi:hypothetical protein
MEVRNMEERIKMAPVQFTVRTGLRAGQATIYGADWCGFTTKQRQAFDAAHLPYQYVNCDQAKGECSEITSYPVVKGWPNPGDSWTGYRPV